MQNLPKIDASSKNRCKMFRLPDDLELSLRNSFVMDDSPADGLPFFDCDLLPPELSLLSGECARLRGERLFLLP